jgi:MraZ protein
MNAGEPFRGEYFHAIDSKSRVTIPSRLRDTIQPREQACAFYAVAEYDGALCLYPPEAYRERCPRFEPDELADADTRTFQRLYYALSEYVEVDRLGRVLLPDRLLKRCGIRKNVAIVGSGDRIEVWDERRWREWSDEKYPTRDELAARVRDRRRGAGVPPAEAAAAPVSGEPGT